MIRGIISILAVYRLTTRYARIIALAMALFFGGASLASCATADSGQPAQSVAQAAPGASATAVTALASPQPTPVATQATSPALEQVVEQELVDASKEYLVGEFWARTELYFGTKRPDQSEVTEEEFQAFVDTVVTPRFPDGLTLLTGYGQFRNSENVIVEERSHALILLYPLQDRDANREIEEIREAYKDRFHQESVLRVDNFAWVSF